MREYGAVRTGRRRAAVLTLGLAVMMTTACSIDRLLEVESPSRIPAERLEEDPANAELLVNSAIGDFECAAGAYAALGGLIGDELVDATQTADRYPYDRRDMQHNDRRYSEFGCTALGVYTPLQSARAAADNVLRLLNSWTDEQVPDRAELIARASAYSGYSLVLLGEGFCSVAISTINADRSIDYGGEIQPDSVFRLAEARFTEALASGDPSIRNMARVGRARARLNLGLFAEAKADAEQVPAGFVRNVTASSTSSRRENKIWQQTSQLNSAASVGEPYRSMDDPRVPVVDANRNSAIGVPIFYQTKYPDASSPMPLATYDEAQLIIAEAEIEAGRLDQALLIINAFRSAAGQGPFLSADPAAIRQELIEQRRRELFLEGQHLGDFIRYELPLDPAPGTPYHGSGVYGAQRCLPLPLVERQNNPVLGT